MRLRRVIALAVGLVVASLLLGGGWLRATLRERDGRLGEARGRLERRADLVRGAVDESLEELRAREDERPFYLYNHFYSPPDVLAISDPVAVSPLAHSPGDPRVVGHFQIDPGGGVRTPYAADEAAPPPLAQRIVETLRTPRFDGLRALATGEGPTVLRRPGPAGVLEGEATPLEGEAAPQRAAVPLDDVEGRGSRLGVRLPVAAEDAERESDAASSAVDDRTLDGDDASGDLSQAEVETEPLTLALNAWGNQQAQEIVAAQRGDVNANRRLVERGRQVPVIARRNVGWDQVQTEPTSRGQRAEEASVGRYGAARPPTTQVRRALEALAPAVRRCAPDGEVGARLRVRGSDGRPETVAIDGVEDDEARACARQALRAFRVAPFDAPVAIVRYAFAGRDQASDDPEVTDAIGLDNLVRRETEVTYTPMVYRDVGGTLLLHRVVSHEGVTVVQGLLLDRARLVEGWIPELVERHSEDGHAPRVVEASEGRCAVRRPASTVLDGVELCFGPAALAGATATLDEELRWQVAGLASLWLIALFAAGAIVSAARRAEALSRQKSAFVSAVSHELRTPLTTLRMHAEMLDEDLVSDERRPKVHRELVRESVRLARLVDNVLSLSKLEEGRRRLHVADGDLAAQVREVVEGQRGFVEERGFTLEGPDPEARLDARFDAQAVEQIVVNLLDNAVKYGAGDEKVIEVEVRGGGAPTVAVRDRGPGIPEAERSRVFERFHRVERAEHAHAPGTGIGLALVAELAEAHGGEASVHPREGGGLEVRVRLASG